MKIEVVKPFRDKNNYNHTFSVGEIVDFAEERAIDIIERGLGKAVHKTATTPTPAKKEEVIETEHKVEEPAKEEEVKEEPKEEVETKVETEPKAATETIAPKRKGRKSVEK